MKERTKMDDVLELLRSISPGDLKIDDRTSVLAELHLTIARTYLFELQKSEETDGRAWRIDRHIAKAIEMLQEYPT